MNYILLYFSYLSILISQSIVISVWICYFIFTSHVKYFEITEGISYVYTKENHFFILRNAFASASHDVYQPFFGSVLLNPKELLSCLIHNERSSVTGLLLFHVRIPRMFAAIAAGMGLSCAGVILQTVMNNSLASPNTIGVNSGAGFAVMIGLALFHGRAAHSAIFAFAGAFLTTLLIFALAYMADSKRTTIILAGITVSSFLSAGINTVKLLSDDITLNLTTFMIGSLSDITTKTLLAPGIAIVIAVIIACFFGSHMNALGLGEDVARSLGIPVSLLRFVLLMLSSVLAGCVVSYAGLLSFVGLIVPHIARRLFGNDMRILVPLCTLLGASFVLFCDTLGRVIAAPYELPAGIILSFVGGPFFLYLLLGKKGGRRVHA